MLLSIAIITNNKNHCNILPYIEKSTKSDYELIIVANGIDLKEATISNPKNLGISKAYNQAWKASSGDFIAFVHTDCYIHEDGWDLKVKKYCRADVGVIGFGGATQLGTADLYVKPYNQMQLVRGGFRSNLINAECHGARMTEECNEVLILDGFVLVINKKLLNECGGFDESFEFYDTDICLESIKRGYKNLAVNVLCEHTSGGKGDFSSEEAYGMDWNMVLNRAHECLYEKWRGFLPRSV